MIFEMLDAIVASALKRIISHQYFKRSIDVEEPKVQAQDRFLRGKQTAYMIFEHFRATGAHEAVLGLPDLCAVSVQGHDIQEFDTKLCYLQEKYPRKMSWRVCARCEYEIPFSFRQYLQSVSKKLIEIEQCQAIKD